MSLRASRAAVESTEPSGPVPASGAVLRGIEVVTVSLILLAGVTAWIAVVALACAGIVALFIGAPIPSLVGTVVLVAAIAAIAAFKAEGTIPRRLGANR